MNNHLWTEFLPRHCPTNDAILYIRSELALDSSFVGRRETHCDEMFQTESVFCVWYFTS